MQSRHKKYLMVIIATVLITSFIGLIVVNLMAAEKKISQDVTHRYAITDPQFLRSMGVLLGPPLVDGNKVETLLNGDRIFASMLAAIRAAKGTITFETYIYWSGDVGKTFADALSERAKNGVKVHVLLDWVGSQKMDEQALEEMHKAGVEVKRYHPIHWYSLGKLNNRTHRKLLVVDGKVGFTGGVGIADKWAGNAQDADHWRDTHYRIEGPSVAQMQAAFMDNWTKVTGKVLHTVEYFPPQPLPSQASPPATLQPATRGGGQFAQVFQSSAEGGAESMHLMYLLSIAAATKTIHLSMAYFAPDQIARDALRAALRRGVKIQILLPGPIIDTEVVKSASRATWGELLSLGAEIYTYQPTMFHCKVLVVDGVWTSVGSTNFDNRSFRLNDEANLNIYDRDVAEEQIRIFNDDLKHSRRVTYEEWESRPWKEKLMDRVTSLINSQL